MSRYQGPVCRLCRREGMKLFLKGDRCFTIKCAIEKRNYVPGEHGQRRTKLSDYGLQLREKQKLESRLDTVVYRLGFAASQAQARQLVRHGHFLVNGRRVTIPSYLLKPGDVVEARERSRELHIIQAALESAKKRSIPSWLELDAVNFKGKVAALPAKEELPVPVQDQLVVALYSK